MGPSIKIAGVSSRFSHTRSRRILAARRAGSTFYANCALTTTKELEHHLDCTPKNDPNRQTSPSSEEHKFAYDTRDFHIACDAKARNPSQAA